MTSPSAACSPRRTWLGSAVKLDANYNCKRHMSPAVPPAILSRLQQLLGVQVDGNVNLFTCLARVTSYSSTHYNCGYLSAISGSACPSCNGAMNRAMILADAGTNRPVVGAEAATTPPMPIYTLKDDLSVTPAASLSVITLLAQCGVKDLSVLQEKVVKIGKKEALGILAAAFKFKTVLTDVFLPDLPKKIARCKREPPEDVIQI
ncbi:hypothetical protein ACQ4PT_002948 [Festuca glaucescens]